MQSIEVMRGGASDLYGSSAIGGVVNVIPVRPAFGPGRAAGSYGGEGTFDDSLLWRDEARTVGRAGGGRGCWGRMGIFRRLQRSAGRWIWPATCTARMACCCRARPRAAAAVCARQRLQRSAQQWNALPDQRDAALALRDRERLAGAARRLARRAGLRLDRALPADIFEHHESAEFWRSRLLFSLR